MASADVDAHYRPFWQNPSALDATGPGSRSIQPPDDLDDLFNEDADINDVSRNVNADASSRLAVRGTGGARGDNDGLGLGLGIDEEVKVRKPRAPIARLDEDRLLSANGITKLRRITKDRLKFKGKGHEFTDISRMLNTYQLWLDDLFPKANFADGLAIIEKLGHKKRMQVMRKEWIDEGKPKPASPDVSDMDDDDSHDRDLEDRPSDKPIGAEDTSGSRATAAPGTRTSPSRNGKDDDDIYAEPTPPPPSSATRNHAPPAQSHETHDAEPDLDELDELLAEEAAGAGKETAKQDHDFGRMNDFDDDEEAMADMW